MLKVHDEGVLGLGTPIVWGCSDGVDLCARNEYEVPIWGSDGVDLGARIGRCSE